MSLIRYACASLVASENSERKTINVDFVIDESVKFNKITFPLTQRGREYLANIPLEEKLSWIHHEQIHELWKEHKKSVRWIGKANKRQTFVPGKIKKTFRIERTGAFLLYNPDIDAFDLECRIDNWIFKITLTPTGNPRFPYKGEYRAESDNTAVKGDWL
jgi:hypothetical protein